MKVFPQYSRVQIFTGHHEDKTVKTFTKIFMLFEETQEHSYLQEGFIYSRLEFSAKLILHYKRGRFLSY